MEQSLQKGATSTGHDRLYFSAVGLDGITPKTGLTGVGRVSKNGGASAATTNNIVEIDAANMAGEYYIILTTTERDTAGKLRFTYAAGASWAKCAALGLVADYDPTAAPTTPVAANVTQINGVAAPSAAGRLEVNETHHAGTVQTAGDIAALVTTVDDLLDTEMPALTAAVAAINTAVDTEVAAIKAKTDQIAFTNAGKVDAAILTAADFATVVQTAIRTTFLAYTPGATYDSRTWEEAIKAMIAAYFGSATGGATTAPVLNKPNGTAALTYSAADVDGNHAKPTVSL